MFAELSVGMDLIDLYILLYIYVSIMCSGVVIKPLNIYRYHADFV